MIYPSYAKKALPSVGSKFLADGILLRHAPSWPVPNKWWCHIHQMWTMAFVKHLGQGVSVALLSHLSVL